jgi:hypothetical protein
MRQRAGYETIDLVLTVPEIVPIGREIDDVCGRGRTLSKLLGR